MLQIFLLFSRVKMFFLNILWIIGNLCLSLPLCFFIWKFISRKSLIQVGLIDLIYRDTVVYIYLFSCSLSAALVHCLAIQDDGTSIWLKEMTNSKKARVFYSLSLTRSKFLGNSQLYHKKRAVEVNAEVIWM